MFQFCVLLLFVYFRYKNIAHLFFFKYYSTYIYYYSLLLYSLIHFFTFPFQAWYFFWNSKQKSFYMFFVSYKLIKPETNSYTKLYIFLIKTINYLLFELQQSFLIFFCIILHKFLNWFVNYLFIALIKVVCWMLCIFFSHVYFRYQKYCIFYFLKYYSMLFKIYILVTFWLFIILAEFNLFFSLFISKHVAFSEMEN